MVTFRLPSLSKKAKWNTSQLYLMLVLLLTATGIPAFALDNGYIQIIAQPGIKVFLDGNYVGQTIAKEGGLILQGVPPGTHTVKVVRQGYRPKEKEIKVLSGRVVHFTIGNFTSKLKIKQEGSTDQTAVQLKVGQLVIQSLPIQSKIRILSISDQVYKKNRDLFRIYDVPAKAHDISVEALGKTLQWSGTLREGEERLLFFNFVDGKVADFNEKLRQKILERSASGRFFLTRDRIIYDTKTDLEWFEAPKKMIWTKAQKWANNIRVNGNGWRLPTRNELESLWMYSNPRDGISSYHAPYFDLPEVHTWAQGHRTYWFGRKRGEGFDASAARLNPSWPFSVVAVRKRTGAKYPKDFTVSQPIPPSEIEEYRWPGPQLPSILKNTTLLVRYKSAPKELAKRIYYSLISAGMDGDYYSEGLSMTGPRRISHSGGRTSAGAKWLRNSIPELKEFKVGEGFGMESNLIIIDLW